VSLGFRELGMQVDVLLARMVRVLVGLNGMTVRDMRMMRGAFVIPFLDLLGSGPMMLCRLLVVLGGHFVQLPQFLHV
jgi:hypothetical protein